MDRNSLNNMNVYFAVNQLTITRISDKVCDPRNQSWLRVSNRSRKVVRLSLCGSISRRHSGDVMSYGVTLNLQVRRVNQLLSLELSLPLDGRLHNTAFDLLFDLLVSPVSLITFPSQEFWCCKATTFAQHIRTYVRVTSDLQVKRIQPVAPFALFA